MILEPGSAFAWQTGPLVASVVDIVENHHIRTAILDVSFTCHMPDCLEMPYHPTVKVRPLSSSLRGGEDSLSAVIVDDDTSHAALPPTGGAGRGANTEGAGEGLLYRLGGNSCLSGDFMGTWLFPRPLSVGDEIIFEDMIHYTTVKTTTFNGIHHPSIALRHLDGTIQLLRKYTYEDYRDRMD
jgi:carboxynorspermidine decarboxylase